jgi:hypothetical protein
MHVEHTRDQLRPLGRGHLSDMKGIDYVEVELFDYINRTAERLLENTKGSSPSARIAIPEVSSQ